MTRAIVSVPRILVVDDNPDDRALAARQLRRELGDVEIVEIGTPEALRAALDGVAFDLILTDYHLRWTDGLDLLREAKTRWPDRPVVMHTGTGSEEVAVAALQAGLDDYILKGAEREHRLGGVVRAAIERARERVERRIVEAELEREIRERRALSASLGRLRRGASAEETAALVVDEIRSAMNVVVAAIHTFIPDTDGPAAVALGIAPGDGAPIAVGERLPAERVATLLERAESGPWVEEWPDHPAMSSFIALTRFTNGTRPDLRFADAVAVGMGADLERATLEAAFEAAGPLPASAWLSVNVSPSVILDGQTLPALLDRWAWLTVLEVTEHEPIADYDAFRAALAALGPRARLAVDDAGAGFSGLRHILELRPQFVKLDIELVRNVDRDPARQALIAGMAHFAAQTDVTLLAEGVETDAERRTLRTLGVSLGQGYLFGRPAPAGDLARPSARASHLAPR